MAKQLIVWEAQDGTRFDTAEEATRHDVAICLRADITKFLIRRDITSNEANDVARIISLNIGWFRSRLDAAAIRG